MRKVLVLKTEELLHDFHLACGQLNMTDEVKTDLIKQAVRKSLSDYESISNKIDTRSLFGVQFDVPYKKVGGMLSDSGEWTKAYYDFIIQYNLLSLRLLSMFQKESIPMNSNPVSGGWYCAYDFGGVVFDHIHLTTSVSNPPRQTLV
jgi:hypothetical protein